MITSSSFSEFPSANCTEAVIVCLTSAVVKPDALHVLGFRLPRAHALWACRGQRDQTPSISIPFFFKPPLFDTRGENNCHEEKKCHLTLLHTWHYTIDRDVDSAGHGYRSVFPA